MQRWACGVSYMGTAYHGWQKQPDLPNTVEQTVQSALEFVADECLSLVCAGRTDSGVHAINQVVHFESTKPRSADNWLMGANRHLPDDVKLQWVVPVSQEFHARYSAQRRRYCYVIYNAPHRHPLLSGRVTWVRRELSRYDAMQAAALSLLGEHDFSSFRDKDCQAKHPVRTLTEFTVVKRGRFCVFYCEANAFLHHMVRNMMGVLIDIGLGRQPVSWAEEVLHARNRARAGVTAPADGLYLMRVDYGELWASVIPSSDDLLQTILNTEGK